MFLVETTLYLLILVVLVISILFTALVIIEKKYKQLKAILSSIKKKGNKKSLNLNRRSVKRHALNIIYINSRKKWFIVISLLSLLVILILEKNSIQPPNDWIIKITLYLFTINVLYAIGAFIHYSLEGVMSSLGFYIMKLLILIIYIISFFIAFLSDLNDVRMLLIIIVVSLGYSFAFIKYVIDSFPSYLFQFVNFILILLLVNFIVIGTTFGFFYLNNYENYQYFNETDFQTIMQSDDMRNIYYVAYKGTFPFFNFPNELERSKDILTYIPFFEHVIGYVFNLLIVGFFVSYSVSKLVERKSLKRLELSK